MMRHEGREHPDTPTLSHISVPARITMGCMFSRSITEGQRAEISGFLRSRCAGPRRYALIGSFTMPLAEVSGAHIDAVCDAAHSVKLEETLHRSSLETEVVLTFGARHDAALSQHELNQHEDPDFPFYRWEILDGDGGCLLVQRFTHFIDTGTATSVQWHLDTALKALGSDEFSHAPRFRAKPTLVFHERAAAEARRAQLQAARLTTEILELAEVAAASERRAEIERWQKQWLSRTGRIHVEGVMRPGALSEAGFLGPTERLDAVSREDASTLSSLGITASQLADRLREIVGEAIRRERSGSDLCYHTIANFRVRIHQYRGFQGCPWSCDDEPEWSSIDFSIENIRTGARLGGPGLIVHLIAEHGFFERAGTPYRVDPRQAANVLELPGSR
ncbi:MAG TPA: hypothetical protein VL242_34720 [Sorangium sp.]|nr:hypothetical protein [Sorangium sp.]